MKSCWGVVVLAAVSTTVWAQEPTQTAEPSLRNLSDHELSYIPQGRVLIDVDGERDFPPYLVEPDNFNPTKVYPSAALIHQIAGKVTLRCMVRRGALGSCKGVDEVPAQHGFQAATQDMVKNHLELRSRNKTYSGQISVVVDWWTQTPPCEMQNAQLNESGLRCYAFVPPPHQTYPKRALENEVEGRVVLQCSVIDEGGRVHCETEVEQPTGYDFGAHVSSQINAYLRVESLDPGVPISGKRFTLRRAYTIGN